MAVSVQIPKEITEYEEKIMFGLSIRKLICFSVAVVLGVGSYFLCTKVLGLTMDTTSYVIIIESLPLMAMGFIKKNGMPFEKYFALVIRHKTGMNQLSYKAELVIDEMSDPITETTERKSKYAWIFETKNGSNAARPQQSRKERKSDAALRECKVFEITKKSRKRKSKETRRTIEAARQEYRAEKRRAQKAVKKGRSAQKHDTAN